MRRQQQYQIGADERLGFAVKRLTDGVKAMQNDHNAKVIFADHLEQKNELVLSAFEDGTVNQYRIDRTFVDQADVRWVVDYKTTYTRSDNIDEFIDEQIADRHRDQLQKYGQLMSQIDHRPIKLAVYFPMLSKLRSWNYEKS